MAAMSYCISFAAAVGFDGKETADAFGSGTGQIWLDDTKCTGAEANILSCSQTSFTRSHNCKHSEDAGVRCQGERRSIKPMFKQNAIEMCIFFEFSGAIKVTSGAIKVTSDPGKPTAAESVEGKSNIVIPLVIVIILLVAMVIAIIIVIMVVFYVRARRR